MTPLGALDSGRSVGLIVAERDDGEHFLGVTVGLGFAVPWAD
jgi:hypothetical protein